MQNGDEVGTRRLRLKLEAFSYCPRVITLVLLAVAATLIALANLSEEIHPRDEAALPRGPLGGAELTFDGGGAATQLSWPSTPWSNISYGWPLTWHQYVLVLGPLAGIVGWCYSASRLALNVAVWLLTLAAVWAASESLARRYRLRFRWNLRAMLLTIALVAMFCAWFATAQRRANLQDPLIAGSGSFWLQCREPKWARWLEILGTDRYCRRIVAAKFDDRSGLDQDSEMEAALARLARLPTLQYLDLQASHLTPAMIAALSDMRGLRVLSVEINRSSARQRDAEWLQRECLAAINNLTALQHLRLHDAPIAPEDLELLSGLTNLRSLYLNGVFVSVSRLPAIPRLESLNLDRSRFKNEYFHHLAALPKLKALSLAYTPATDAGLAQLASLPSLEELVITDGTITSPGLDALLAVKRLRKLHLREHRGGLAVKLALHDGTALAVRDFEADSCRRALADLRRTKPGIVLDGDEKALTWPGTRLLPSECVPAPENGMTSHRFVQLHVGQWKDGQNEFQRAGIVPILDK